RGAQQAPEVLAAQRGTAAFPPLALGRRRAPGRRHVAAHLGLAGVAHAHAGETQLDAVLDVLHQPVRAVRVRAYEVQSEAHAIAAQAARQAEAFAAERAQVVEHAEG